MLGREAVDNLHDQVLKSRDNAADLPTTWQGLAFLLPQVR
jgi:hypothetical protein